MNEPQGIVNATMKLAILASLGLLTLGPLAPNCVAENANCASELAQAKQVAAKQDYATFDQTAGGGWRLLAEKDTCLAEAGELIDFYLARRPDLQRSQRVNLSFHAGQVYALAGKNDDAVKRFRRAVVNPSVPLEFKWSEYVLATIAFLEHDADSLVKNRDIIADAVSYSSNGSNLQVVDLLIKNFGRSYKDAIRSKQ
jgi:hypothetical protein